MKVLIVVGTRPNFIKVSQFKKELKNSTLIDLKIVHTGQHYDVKMADVFFSQLNIKPDFYLNIAPNSACSQVAEIMIKLEELILNQYKPDLIVVVGDVNSTLAAAIAANKLNIKLAHLESGLRSRDRTMPEELNRIITDELSEVFFITEKSGYENLIKEGKNKDQLFMVGNTMIDSLIAFKPEIEKNEILNKLNLKLKEYILLTIHRPATVDYENGLINLIEVLKDLNKTEMLVFPIHPRTIKKLIEFGLYDSIKNLKNLQLIEPLDYFSFQKLLSNAKLIITDSGGIQEETTYEKIPCLTLRPNTERPITVEIGSNILIPFEINIIRNYINKITNGEFKKSSIPELWDGNASKRIIKVLENMYLKELENSKILD